MKQLRLGIFPNMDIEKTRASFTRVLEMCRVYGITVFLPAELAAEYGTEPYIEGEKGVATSLDAAVSLGGDGTFLRMARQMAHLQVPVFGVNFGHLGFLAEVDYQGMHKALKNLCTGNYTYEKRHLLQAEVTTATGEHFSDLALNEFVLGKTDLARIAHLELDINGRRSGIYAADGIIVSTATGSTGYSLSAGGPLVEPGLDIMIITPICAHALSARPLVIPSSEAVTLQIKPPDMGLLLSADGTEICRMQVGDQVTIKAGKECINFIKLTGRSYYDTWQEKLIRNI